MRKGGNSERDRQSQSCEMLPLVSGFFDKGFPAGDLLDGILGLASGWGGISKARG